MTDFEQLFKEKVEKLKGENLYRSLTLSQGLEFHHNDYLGLATHPEIAEAIASATKVTGSGSRGSRLLGGHSRLFEETEEKICEFFNAPAALIFSSGYLANLAVLQVLSECVDHVFSDECNHASLIDGIRLGKKTKTIVPHQSWKTLSPTRGRKLFVAEGLYSMEGDLLDREVFVSSVKEHAAFAHVDEAHSAGVFFEGGRGFELWRDLGWEALSQTITFGKAFGVSGAAILCSKALKELIVNRGRTFIYTTAPSPVVLIGIQKALELVHHDVWRREELWSRSTMVGEILKPFVPSREGNWQKRSPILAVQVSGEERALCLAKNMREFGVEVRAIRYPTVPRGCERIRLTLNLQVSRENTEIMARLFLQELFKI